MNGELEQVIKEFTGSVNYLIENNERSCFELSLLHCCGESPYISKRIFSFDKNEAVLLHNYVEYTETIPLDYLNQTYQLDYLEDHSYQVLLDQDYNLRYYPSVDKFVPRNDEEETVADFTCFKNTNIIAQLKRGALVTVVDRTRYSTDGKTWLYIEVSTEDIIGDCNPVNFDFEGQKLRGWISDKFTTIAR